VVGFSDAVKDKELARGHQSLAAAAARSERCRDRQRCEDFYQWTVDSVGKNVLAQATALPLDA
jgi:hypothetical protein